MRMQCMHSIAQLANTGLSLRLQWWPGLLRGHGGKGKAPAEDKTPHRGTHAWLNAAEWSFSSQCQDIMCVNSTLYMLCVRRGGSLSYASEKGFCNRHCKSDPFPLLDPSRTLWLQVRVCFLQKPPEADAGSSCPAACLPHRAPGSAFQMLRAAILQRQHNFQIIHPLSKASTHLSGESPP